MHHHQDHLKFYKHVLKSLRTKQSSEFEAKNAIKTVQLINAIYKSIESNKEIFLKNNIISKKLGK